ncbi:MAG: hypothetical protein J7M26_05365 [Armatimonadetes bacterium]|nr:hypothetical protein [Armatimonadota bacterium]
MSYERGVKRILLQPTDLVGQCEWTAPIAREAMIELTGLDPMDGTEAAFVRLYEVFDLDVSWGGAPAGNPLDWDHPEQYEDQPVSQWGIFASYFHEHGAHMAPREFSSPEEVFEFDPLSYDKRTEDELADIYQQQWDAARRQLGDRCLPLGAFYTTLFHWGIAIFGWENFMAAAALYPDRYERLLDKFFEVSRRHLAALARVEGPPALISHDDIAMTRGLVFRPEWYRKYITPRYAELWQPALERGKKVLFCSDGNFQELVPDIAEAGAGGFIIEPLLDLDWLAREYGQTHVIIGGVDTKLLQNTDPDGVWAEVERVFKALGHCPGFFVNASGQLTHLISPENMRAYLEATRHYRREYGQVGARRSEEA